MDGLNKDNLNKRICDVVDCVTITQTWREFIKLKYKDVFCLDITDEEIDNWSEEYTTSVFNELSWLLD